MDEGPFRMPRSAEGNATNKPEPTPEPVEAPKPVREEPKPVHRATASPNRHQGEGSFKRFILPIAAVLIVIILAVVGWVLLSSSKSAGTGIDSSKYQAVFFVNDNVYFGKLQDFNDEYYKMTKVYYPQTQQSDTDGKQQATTNQNNITLLKLSDAIHGPDDSMMIAKDQVLFYQNLKSDSKVSKLIDGQK